MGGLYTIPNQPGDRTFHTFLFHGGEPFNSGGRVTLGGGSLALKV